MKALIEIGETQKRALDDLARKAKRSRTAVIREAIDEYLGKRRRADEREAFGLWGKRKIDGLAYEAKVRGEWSRR